MRMSVNVLVLSGMRLTMVLVGCLLLMPWSAHARGSVRDYILAARSLYEDLEYENALEQLSRARPFSTGSADEALLSLYEGCILADLGKQEASSAAFKTALYLQPDAMLPMKVSPKVVRRFESLRAQVKRSLAKRGDVPRREAEARPVPPVVPAPSPQVMQASSAAPVSLAVPVAEVSGVGGMRGRAWLPASVGGVLLVGSGVSYALALHERSRLRGEGPPFASLQDAERSAARGRTYQSVSWGLMGAGVVGLGISAGMYLLGRPEEPGKVGLSVSTDGTSAFLSGRWP
ncbi:hypothetical protein F0U60_47045 [Archangium minus]|uniref:Tetratricopeptide repeat protein n=1 Tax=Archangium minus TaxID=83450 RepID=A0ABY9X694_9BACT|nr:hypothetical protein F0U60_47045 [Archangium minus]